MTLTAVAVLTKRFIFLSVLSLILGITAFIGYRIWYANYLASIPPVEEKPDTQFGSLPKPTFPEVSVSSSNFSYTLDTTTGGLPDFNKIIKVYFIPKAYATLLAADKSRAMASQFGLDVSPTIISETRYLFGQGTKSLTIDLDTGNFNFKQEASAAGTPNQVAEDEREKLITDFKNFLNSKGLSKEELQSGPTKTTPITLDEAPAFEISVWPQDIDQKPILTGNPNKSLVNATIINNARNIENYLSLNYTYWPIDISTFSTYPAKPIGTAFDDLKSGEGIIVAEPINPQVSITSVYLAYFLQANYSPYLQPIYVFEGPSFQAYVLALDDQFVSQ